ncbi:NADP oxidoreductase [Paraburkholderia rhynchosiae]|uniref:NADP oxidoreductase n=3 Tax=Paraburkholderia rhynchosiae TaxID=487049 RepID=A0ABX4UXC3_9BURK|nr:NADP oxidoreductase [Paraburkholderia rhynchosiae]
MTCWICASYGSKYRIETTSPFNPVIKETTMKIGIIGAGNIGATLARKFSAAGHQVLLANSRGPQSIQSLATEAGAVAATVTDAVKDVDVVVISIPQKAVPHLPKALFAGLPENVVIIDTGNYYPAVRDETITAIEGGIPESQWVSQQIGRPVVKAFNSIMAQSLATKGQPAGTKGRIALPVSGDDAQAKKIVIGLVDEAGFDAIDAGTLAESWRHQPGAPAYCTDLDADELRLALTKADKARSPQLRDLTLQKMAGLAPGYTGEDLLKINRSLHE